MKADIQADNITNTFHGKNELMSDNACVECGKNTV